MSSSIRVRVIKDSISPTAAKMKEKGAMNTRVSQVKGMLKLTRLGSSPPMDAMSRTTSVSKSNPITIKLTVPIAAREEGNCVVSLGSRKMIAIVSAIRPAII